MTTLLVLLAAITFSRVLTNCTGAPEEVAFYRLLATTRYVGPLPCTDELGQAATCPGTIPGPSLESLSIILDPGTGTVVSVPVDLIENPHLLPTCSPAPCLTAWPWGAFAVAYDRAGNRSGVCP